MKQDIKVILIVIITLAIMFATSLLLDLQIVQNQFIRKAIIHIAIIVQLVFGFITLKDTLSS